MITTNNLPIHEMIGLETEIIRSSNPQILGVRGTIIDETKNMFIINTSSGIKKIPKNINIWKFSINSEQKEIEGASLAKRSYERWGRKI